MGRKRKKRKKSFKLVLILIIMLSIIGVGYSYLSVVLNITGEVTGQYNENYTVLPGSNPNLKVTVVQTNKWQEGNSYKYQYAINVTNIGQDTIDNFVMTIEFFNNIDAVTIWNYDSKITGKTLTITNNNYSLNKQQTLTVDFIITSKNANQSIKTVKLDVSSNKTEVTLDQFNVKFNIAGSWEQYVYQYDVMVTNKTGSRINAWELSVVLPEGTSYVTGWNATFNFNNGILIIKNESHNGRLNNNSSTTFGLQLSTNIINYIPSNIKVTVR